MKLERVIVYLSLVLSYVMGERQKVKDVPILLAYSSQGIKSLAHGQRHCITYEDRGDLGL